MIITGMTDGVLHNTLLNDIEFLNLENHKMRRSNKNIICSAPMVMDIQPMSLILKMVSCCLFSHLYYIYKCI